MNRAPVDQLKVWLDKTPFKSTNAQIKKDTFYAIINAAMALKQADLDKLCGDSGALNDKLAITFSKYLFKAFELIGNNDQRKYISFMVFIIFAHIQS